MPPSPIAPSSRPPTGPRSARWIPAAPRPGRLTLLVIVATVVLTACSSGRGTQTAPTFLEEFEEFPIYHGEPARSYVVLGAVYDANAAERGPSPMKRAAVAAARDQGADAVIVGVRFDDTGQPTNSTGPPLSSTMKWEYAVSIRWK